MRALFYADAHIGAGQRIADQVEVLAKIADVAFEREVDCVLFGGDATHHRSVVEEVAAFQDHVDYLGQAGHQERPGVPFLAVPGNHDRSTMDVPSTLEVACAGFKHAFVANRPMVLGNIKDVAICALPWAPTAAIAALDPFGMHDDVVRTATETLMDIARGLRAMVTGRAVLLLHWSLAGAVTPTGALVDEFREVVLPTVELAEVGFDAILAGHIHSAGPIGEHACPVLYAGSPAVCDFGEADTPHGVWIFEVGDGPVTTEFVPIEDRRFITVGYNHEFGAPETHDTFKLNGAIVRVRYEATVEQERLVDHAKIRSDLEAHGAHRVHSIQPTITGPGSTRVAVTEDLDIDDALALWLESQDEPFDPRVVAVHHEIREAVR